MIERIFFHETGGHPTLIAFVIDSFLENGRLLKYEHGQFYKPHHDYIDHQRDRHCGPRILTFFLYLSDVEEGGACAFVS